VRRAALDYVEGFYEGDSTKHVRSVRPDVFKYGFWLPRDSTRYRGEQMPWPEFLSYTRRMRARGATTRKYDGRWMVSSVLWQSKPRVGP
jgi:hypothetical protein